LKTLITLLLSLLSVLFLLLFYYLFFYENASPTGVAHESFPSMYHSTKSNSDSTTIFIGSAFGIISIIIFVIFLSIGIHQKENSKTKIRVWVIGLIIYLGIFIAGIVDYVHFTNSDSVKLFLGFPVPTAWMLFGIYLYPLFFTFFYVTKFKYWVLGDEKEKQFRKLCKKSLST